MSDSGGEVGAETFGYLRPDVAIVGSRPPLTCAHASIFGTYFDVAFVVVLDVAGSSPVTHPMLHGG